LRRRRLFGSVDHRPSAEICFVTIGSLERAERMFQYKVSRLMTVFAQRKEKRRIVACIEAASCS